MRRIASALLVLGLLAASAPAAYAQGPLPHLTSTQLLSHARRWSGKVIVYRGEVVGSPFHRGLVTWINVSDGQNAIGIELPTTQTDKIQNFGSYWRQGDIVSVQGVFWREDPSQSGETDIQGQVLRIVRPGHARTHPVPALLWWLAATSVAIAAGLWAIARRRFATDETE